MFSFYRTITIDKTKVLNTDQIDFPVLISGTYSYLKTTGNGGDVTDANGYDVGFYSDVALTTKLKWEIERYVDTTGEVIFWVKVPIVYTAVDTVIYMAYGDATISTFQGDINGTWNSNYKAVHHLPDGTTLTAPDSTSNANNGVLGAFGPAPTSTGMIGGGALAVPGDSPHINLGNAASLEMNQIVSFTLRASFSDLSLLQNIFCKGSEDYRLRLNGTSLDWGSYDGSDHQTSYTFPYAVDTIHTISGEYDGLAWRLYVDGSQVSFAIDIVGAIPNSGDNLQLMSSTGGSQRFMSGSMDEFRLSNNIPGPDWFATEHNSLESPSTFYTVGNATVPSSGTVNRFLSLLGVGQ